MDQKKPHKHAKMIKAWADGHPIQYFDPHRKEWMMVGKCPLWEPELKYRIRPNTFTFRIAAFRGRSTWHAVCDSKENEAKWQVLGTFERWVTPWIEVEVEVE